MKTPKARRLPSGQWFCRVRIDDQDIGITKPTEKEAVAEAMAVKAGIKKASKKTGKTVTQAIDDYIESKSNVLSPSTIRGYRIVQRNRFRSVMNRKISDLSEAQWQRFVNDEARLCSAKTLANAWGLMNTVIKLETGMYLNIRLPQVIPNEHEFLDVDQVQIFLEAIRGNPAEIPALLALSSLRASEILALTWDNVDLKKGWIYVRGSTVPDENGKLVKKKENKTRNSRRDVPIIPPLRTALEAVEGRRGLVYPKTEQNARKRINLACSRAGLPQVGLHGLRHSFASLCVYLGIQPDYAMKIGGWSDYHTMKKIYTHVSNRDLEKASQPLIDFFCENFNEKQDKNGNENGNEK